MKKKIIALLAAAMMTLAAGNAFAAFSNGDLIQVVIDTSINGVGSEVATDLGSITSLEADSNTIVSNLSTANSSALVQYFAVNTTGYGVSVAGITPTVDNGISSLSYNKTSTAATSLRAVTGYYAVPGTDGTLGANAYGYTTVTANTKDVNSLGVKGFQSNNAPGYFLLFNGTNAANAYSSLANLATTPINMTLYSFSNTNSNASGSNITTPGVAIEIASNGDVIINAAQTPATPIPAAAYLLGSGLLGLLGFRRKNNA